MSVTPGTISLPSVEGCCHNKIVGRRINGEGDTEYLTADGAWYKNVRTFGVGSGYSIVDGHIVWKNKEEQ